MLFWVAHGKGAPEHTNNLTAFQKRQVERYFGNTGWKANHQKPAVPCHGSDARLCIGTADCIIDHIYTIWPCQLFDITGHFLLRIAVHFARINQRFIGANPAAKGGFFFAGHRCDHFRPHGFAKLNRGCANAARGAQNQEGFTGFKGRAVAQCVMGCAVGKNKASCFVIGHRVGYFDHPGGRCCQVRNKTANAGHG